MCRILILLALLVAPAFAQGAPADPGQSRTVADPIPAKPPLKLTDTQKQKIAQALNGRDTLDQLPEGFTAAIGAKIPTQKKLAAHPLPRPLVYDIPVLKQYEYAQLADRVLIIDPLTKTVADIVPR